MVALNTNVLVRFLVKDDVRQANQAAAFIDRTVKAGEDLFIADVVVCETAWVLGSSYKVGRDEIGRILSELVRARHVVFASVDQLSRALAAFAAGKGDLADYMIREQARTAGSEDVVTFDRDLLRENGFRSP